MTDSLLDREGQRLLIAPGAPRATDFETCQGYLKTRGVQLVDVFHERDLSTPAYWIVAGIQSGHEYSRGVTWVWAYAEYTGLAPW